MARYHANYFFLIFEYILNFSISSDEKWQFHEDLKPFTRATVARTETIILKVFNTDGGIVHESCLSRQTGAG